MKKKKKYYIDNKEFFLDMVRYKQSVEESVQKGLPKPRIPDSIGLSIKKIAEQLSMSPQFFQYSFREEMVGDGIENCIMYIDNFDPDKSRNPFAYFTSIIWYAFIRRIQREKRQQVIKIKNMQRQAILESLGEEMGANPMLPTDAMNDLVAAFEANEAKRKAKKPVGVEKLVEDEEVK